MYVLVDWIFAIGSLVLAVWLPIHLNEGAYCLIGLIAYLLYPLIMEPIYDLFSIMLFSSSNELKHQQILNRHTGLPIVYHANYNITACGIEKAHPFDSCKYQRVYEDLVSNNILNEKKVWKPIGPCGRGLMLSLGVSWTYLLSLCYSWKVFRVVEVPVCVLPGAFLRWRLLSPMLYATQGSIDAAYLAIQNGWAINIGGGYHHASLSNGGGFCVYPDITLAINYIRQYQMKSRVMIVDLDAHQGNGHERDFINDQNTFIVDFYNHYIYPNDGFAAQGIKEDVSVSRNDSDETYLNKLKKSLTSSIEQFKPEFLLYNAGTDCMESDPLGGMNLSASCIIMRDQIVFQLCQRHQIPILMVLSGGYLIWKMLDINALTPPRLPEASKTWSKTQSLINDQDYAMNHLLSSFSRICNMSISEIRVHMQQLKYLFMRICNLLLLTMIVNIIPCFAYVEDGFCYDRFDAENCDTNYKCCDRYNDCGTDYDSCLPQNNGVPMTNHCYYLDCQYCCVMTKERHYCATQQDCKSLKLAQDIATAVIVIYLFSVLTCVVYGCFKRRKVRMEIQNIARESAAFDQTRQNRGGGVINAMIQGGAEIISMIK